MFFELQSISDLNNSNGLIEIVSNFWYKWYEKYDRVILIAILKLAIDINGIYYLFSVSFNSELIDQRLLTTRIS